MDETTLRRDIVASARQMNALGINQGTSGNISARHGDHMLIPPSSTPYDSMGPADVAMMALDGGPAGWTGPLAPSTEWRFHRDILRARPDAGAVVHTHATYCTTLAILRRDIPAVHYMMAAFGGSTIRCAPYAAFGTAELAVLAVQALQGRQACLLANHGMIVIGATLGRAMWLAVELETLAKYYYLSLQVGTPAILTESEIADAATRIAGYGPGASP